MHINIIAFLEQKLCISLIIHTNVKGEIYALFYGPHVVSLKEFLRSISDTFLFPRYPILDHLVLGPYRFVSMQTQGLTFPETREHDRLHDPAIGTRLQHAQGLLAGVKIQLHPTATPPGQPLIALIAYNAERGRYAKIPACTTK